MDDKYPLILALDTATPCSCVALTRGDRGDGRVIASLSLSGSVSHSRRLLGAVDYLLRETGTEWPDIDGICVGLGPGSFTGLRIGMATAKGLAEAAEKPLLGVSTLDAIASRCVADQLICSVLDARKKEVYTAQYRCDADGLSTRVSDMVVVSPEECAAAIDEPVLMVGDGALQYSEQFRSLLGEKLTFAPAQLHHVSAESLGMLAAEQLCRGDKLDLVECAPLYIRRSDAELNLLAKKKAGSGTAQGNRP